MSQDSENSVLSSYRPRFGGTRAIEDAEARYNTEELLLWIEHSSEACYKKQLEIERGFKSWHGQSRMQRLYLPLVRLAYAEYKRTIDAEFRVVLGDVASGLAKDYVAGYRRGELNVSK